MTPKRQGDCLPIRKKPTGTRAQLYETQTALEAMITAYRQAVITLPKNSLGRTLLEGAFGSIPEMAAQILAESRGDDIKNYNSMKVLNGQLPVTDSDHIIPEPQLPKGRTNQGETNEAN